MMKNSRHEILRAAAIFAVISNENGLDEISIGNSRNEGSIWANEHRRIAVGKRSLMKSKIERSNIR
tara:strand:- start:313 stop:510 length:198 start_codon:yes stop_codon:yes gene_type:complete